MGLWTFEFSAGVFYSCVSLFVALTKDYNYEKGRAR